MLQSVWRRCPLSRLSEAILSASGCGIVLVVVLRAPIVACLAGGCRPMLFGAGVVKV